jgi:hypothetical protein
LIKKGKKLMIIGAVAGLLALPLSAFAATNQDVNVSASVNGITPASFTTNFDAVSFTGDVGSIASGTYSAAGQPVDQPEYTVTSALNYQMMVTGTDLVASDGTTLNSNRISIIQTDPVNGFFEGSTEVTKDVQTQLYSSSNPEDAVAHTLSFSLDLGNSDSYTDNDTLSSITGNEQFNSTVTFSLTGL